MSLPVHSDDAGVRILLDPDGVPYSIVTSGSPTATVIAALDDDGRPRGGWPIAIPGAYVDRVEGAAFADDGTLYLNLDIGRGNALTALRRDGTIAAGWPAVVDFRPGTCDVVLPVADGTVRLFCGSGRDAGRVYAFDGHGGVIPGWPVEIAGSDAPIVLGTSLVGVQSGRGWARRYTITADGTVRFGREVVTPADGSPCNSARTLSTMRFLGPDGTGYLWSYQMGAPEGPDACRFPSSTYTAFDDGGARAGWPVTVAGESSEPVLGPEGRIYVTQGNQQRHPTRIYAFDARGRPVLGWPVTIDVAPAIGQGGADPVATPAPVFVGADRTVYLVTESDGTTIYALDPEGNVLPGWPYRSTSVLGETSLPCTLGSGHPVVTPVIDAQGRIHVVHAASLGSSWFGSGSRLALVADGRTSAGWPVTLRRAGSRFVKLEVDAVGITYALALEYEGPLGCFPLPKSSDTLLAIASDGTVLYRTTLVEP